MTAKVDMLSTVATMAVTFVSVKKSGESSNQHYINIFIQNNAPNDLVICSAVLTALNDV